MAFATHIGAVSMAGSAGIARPVRPSGSGVSTVLDAVDAAFDLSSRNTNVLSEYHSLSGEDRESFIEITAALLRQGHIGTVTYEVDGRPVRTDVTVDIANHRNRGARYYDERRDDPPPPPVLSLTA